MTPAAVAIVILFVLTGVFFAVRLVTSGNRDDRIFDASHVLMSVMMILMTIGWSERIPAALQLTVFTGFGLWYVYLAMFRPTAPIDLQADAPAGHHSGRPRLLYHAGMMGSMAWTAVIMAPLPSAGAMNMAMSGPQHGGAGNGAASSMPLHPWADPLSIMIGIAFACAAIWYIGRFVQVAGTRSLRDPAEIRRLADFASSTAMAAGMALSFLLEMT